MIRKIFYNIATTAKLSIVAGVLALGIGVALPAPTLHAADPTYSCGTYGAGSYSAGGDACTTTSGGGGTTDPDTDNNGNGVGAPNTGFAKFMEPINLLTIIGSLALLAGGIVLLLMARGKKKHVSFKGRG